MANDKHFCIESYEHTAIQSYTGKRNKRRASMEIEAFRKQLIDANPKTASPTKKQLLSEDLAIAYEALDRITDNLGELINETNDTDELVYYAQIRGELCSHFNGIAMLLEDHNQDIS
ncbi:hypothetical protein OAK65_01420 [Synechococcus sp. AH-551-N17]|nr:hypothetical protein [Synechococcus sp. AH-551-N17]